MVTYGRLIAGLVSDFLVDQDVCDWQTARHLADRFERLLQTEDCLETHDGTVFARVKDRQRRDSNGARQLIF